MRAEMDDRTIPDGWPTVSELFPLSYFRNTSNILCVTASTNFRNEHGIFPYHEHNPTTPSRQNTLNRGLQSLAMHKAYLSRMNLHLTNNAEGDVWGPTNTSALSPTADTWLFLYVFYKFSFLPRMPVIYLWVFELISLPYWHHSRFPHCCEIIFLASVPGRHRPLLRSADPGRQ
jgi:hypothetical protein